jgi:glucosamine-6-phosphate deaminase
VRIRVLRDSEAVAAAAARRVLLAIGRKPAAVLGLPAGRTPVRLYDRLAAAHARGAVDLSRVTTFNLDEFVGLPPTDPGSYRAFMERHLFRRVRLRRARTHLLDGRARDLPAECTRYERAISAAGGIDLQILGLGINGHVGFNEPAPQLDPLTHLVRLTSATRRANAAWFGNDLRHVPREALSMGLGTILRARQLLLLATGRTKALVVRRAVEGPVTTWLPASFLQLHANVEVILDREAASRLTEHRGQSGGRA